MGEIHDVEVFWERWRAASLVARSVETLAAEFKDPDPVIWKDEDVSGVYKAEAGGIVSQLLVREV